MSKPDHYSNHLANETSPYLLQHAHNPVDWYPWGPEALARAQQENKPILLSVGYSACHWCHVMAHESFEDSDTAAVMNALFINIKVDREERPDIDKIYQTAHSLLAQRAGGWPLTLFLTPDRQIPFFGGTYFPDKERHGMPAFSSLCRQIAGVYRDRRDEIEKQNISLMDFISGLDENQTPGQVNLTAMPLDIARQQLQQQFDDTYGGFGKAPKFPHPTNLDRLLRHWAGSCDAEADEAALHMVSYTLERMAQGGMNDQIGGGFCRYSVDEKWMIPHFEKMLYDNGPLLSLYTDAWLATTKPLFEHTARQTADWVLREMQSPEGGYYSSLDADSEGEEGKFYAWHRDEVQTLLSADEYCVFELRYGFNQPANFENKWNPHIFLSRETIAGKLNLSVNEVETRITSARRTLFQTREQRVHPDRDDKVLVSWNALMIKGLAQAARAFDEPHYQQSAERALQFIQDTMWQHDRLYATCKDGHAHLAAYLDDYVFLIDAILELLQLRWRSGDLVFALQLADVVLKHFAAADGGFYFTADDHETLIQRPRPFSDDALPAGNAIAVKILGRLGYLLGENRYLDAAENTLKAAWPAMQQSPYGHTGLLLGLEEYLNPVTTVIIRGDDTLHAWKTAADTGYHPRRCVYAIPNDADNLPGLLQQRKPASGGIAYICTGTNCQLPVTDIEQL